MPIDSKARIAAAKNALNNPDSPQLVMPVEGGAPSLPELRMEASRNAVAPRSKGSMAGRDTATPTPRAKTPRPRNSNTTEKGSKAGGKPALQRLPQPGEPGYKEKLSALWQTMDTLSQNVAEAGSKAVDMQQEGYKKGWELMGDAVDMQQEGYKKGWETLADTYKDAYEVSKDVYGDVYAPLVDPLLAKKGAEPLKFRENPRYKMGQDMFTGTYEDETYKYSRQNLPEDPFKLRRPRTRMFEPDDWREVKKDIADIKYNLIYDNEKTRKELEVLRDRIIPRAAMELEADPYAYDQTPAEKEKYQMKYNSVWLGIIEEALKTYTPEYAMNMQMHKSNKEREDYYRRAIPQQINYAGKGYWRATADRSGSYARQADRNRDSALEMINRLPDNERDAWRAKVDEATAKDKSHERIQKERVQKEANTAQRIREQREGAARLALRLKTEKAEKAKIDIPMYMGHLKQYVDLNRKYSSQDTGKWIGEATANIRELINKLPPEERMQYLREMDKIIAVDDRHNLKRPPE